MCQLVLNTVEKMSDSEATWSSLVHNVNITSEDVLTAYKGWAGTYEQDLTNLRTTGQVA